MSKRYTFDHKRLVLKIMQDFQWDVTKTALYSAVPERALRQWKWEYRQATLRSRAAAAPSLTPAAPSCASRPSRRANRKVRPQVPAFLPFIPAANRQILEHYPRSP